MLEIPIEIVEPMPPTPTYELETPLTPEGKKRFGETLLFSLQSHPNCSSLLLSGEAVKMLAAVIEPKDLPEESRPGHYDVFKFSEMMEHDRVYVYVIQALTLASERVRQLVEKGRSFCDVNYSMNGGIEITFTPALHSTEQP